MRRAYPVIAATAGTLALLANFHTTPSTSTLATAVEPTSTPPSTASASSDPTSTTLPPARTIDGADIPTRFGDVQVRVSVAGTRIVDVQPIRMPFDHERSARISDEAGPMLRSEVLQAQSARINIISGATYTSDAYATSLQGALDKM